MGAEGGERSFNVSASGSWVAMTESPWITISPANGRGSQVCTVKIDSTVLFDQRKGTVRIQSLDDETEKNDFEVIQKGFDYQISLDDTQKDIEEYAGFGERWFEVKVKSNVDFDVVLPDGAGSWLTYKKGKLELDRGSRPREVTVRFDYLFAVLALIMNILNNEHIAVIIKIEGINADVPRTGFFRVQSYASDRELLELIQAIPCVFFSKAQPAIECNESIRCAFDLAVVPIQVDKLTVFKNDLNVLNHEILDFCFSVYT